MPPDRPLSAVRTRRVPVRALYVEETFNAMAGWLRVIGGYGVAWAGALTRNDYWRHRGTRARLVGTVQRQLGARATAIERVVAGPALRRTDR